MSQMKEDRDEAFFVFVEDFIVQLKSATVVLLRAMGRDEEAEQIAPHNNDTEAAKPTMPHDEHDDEEAQQLEDPQ